tara:strand:+ start:5571 stop:5762 length:192 start_codon:yes stop_codon:yes gene_type:complete
MTQVYMVVGLGLGDDEEVFENMGVFSTLALAAAFVEQTKAEFLEDSDGEYEGEFNIEEYELDA